VICEGRGTLYRADARIAVGVPLAPVADFRIDGAGASATGKLRQPRCSSSAFTGRQPPPGSLGNPEVDSQRARSARMGSRRSHRKREATLPEPATGGFAFMGLRARDRFAEDADGDHRYERRERHDVPSSQKTMPSGPASSCELIEERSRSLPSTPDVECASSKCSSMRVDQASMGTTREARGADSPRGHWARSPERKREKVTTAPGTGLAGVVSACGVRVFGAWVGIFLPSPTTRLNQMLVLSSEVEKRRATGWQESPSIIARSARSWIGPEVARIPGFGERRFGRTS